VNDPFRIGLTGGIGMGKSTTAAMFAAEGAAVWDADAAVHRLYAPGGAAVAPVAALCPEALRDGAIDRAVLSNWLKADPDRLHALEAVVHPLVREDRRHFLSTTPADIAVLDVPLLFETGSERDMDLTVTVSAPADVQRARVLARPGMTAEKLALILSRQMPDAQRRRRADITIDTTTLEGAREAVRLLVRDIRAGKHARDRSRHRDDGL
jgi:dephospho-CoA kinase